MADHDVMDLVVFNVVSGDLTGEGTLTVATDVLSANQNAGVYCGLYEGKMEESGKHHNVCFSATHPQSTTQLDQQNSRHSVATYLVFASRIRGR